MKYADPQLRSMLAAEYVLGTLHGRARRRFERLLARDAGLRDERAAWERRFAGLLRGYVPQVPRDIVWTAIDRTINASRVAPIAPIAPGNVRSSSGAVWRVWAVAASVACIALSTALVNEMRRGPQIVTQMVRVEVPVPQPAAYVAMLQPGQSDAKWMVAMTPSMGLIKVSSSGNYPADYGKQCLQLWVIDDGGKPHSLGVMPETEGEAQMPMPKDMPMPQKPTLAVSVEPKGGSPTGLPTGPVITSGRAMRTS